MGYLYFRVKKRTITELNVVFSGGLFMKKILLAVVGLVLSTGLYAASDCKELKNFVTSIDGNKYLLNGNLCKSDGKATGTLESYIVFAGSEYNGQKNSNVGPVSLTFNKQTILLKGNLAVAKLPKETTTSVFDFFADFFSQVIKNPARSSSSQEMDYTKKSR